VESAQDISWQEASQDNDSYHYHHTKKKIEKLAKVQRRATEFILKTEGCYASRYCCYLKIDVCQRMFLFYIRLLMV